MNQSQFQRAAGISAGLAARWFPHIDTAMNEFSITSPLDRAMFIAQCGHESTSFTQMVESFNYSVAGLAGFVKAKRITQDQANTLGVKLTKRFYRSNVNERSLISSTTIVLAIRLRAMAGNTEGVELSGSPSSKII
jgi:predicted chitinase